MSNVDKATPDSSHDVSTHFSRTRIQGLKLWPRGAYFRLLPGDIIAT